MFGMVSTPISTFKMLNRHNIHVYELSKCTHVCILVATMDTNINSVGPKVIYSKWIKMETTRFHISSEKPIPQSPKRFGLVTISTENLTTQ